MRVKQPTEPSSLERDHVRELVDQDALARGCTCDRELVVTAALGRQGRCLTAEVYHYPGCNMDQEATQ
jgi:hypothetical protein